MGEIMVERITALTLSLVASLTFAGDLSLEDRRAIRKLHDQFYKLTDGHPKYCVFGNVQSLNLTREAGVPTTTNSQFIVLWDQAKRIRRHSCLKEVIRGQDTELLDWYTRIQFDGKLKGGFEYPGRGIDGVEEAGITHSLVIDYDPWNLSVASAFAAQREHVFEGYFSRVCDLSKAIRYERVLGGQEVTYQYGSMTRVTVFFSEQAENLPTKAVWAASLDANLNPNPDGNDYYKVHETQTRWFQYEKSWLPYRVDLGVFQGTTKSLLMRQYQIDLNWVLDENLQVENSLGLTSVELLEAVESSAIKSPNRREK